MNAEENIEREVELTKLAASSPSPPERGLGGEAIDARLTANKSSWHRHLKSFSSEMRRNPTAAEYNLWQALRNHQVAGIKFRRQHAIGNYIVDFISTDHYLIIEVDGEVHAEQGQAEYDAGRSHTLQELGYRILRFSNQQVLHELEETLQTIQSTINQHNKQ